MTSAILRKLGLGCAIAAAALAATPAAAQQAGTLKLGIVTFLSGGAAGPFGVPARNAAELDDRSAQRRHIAGALRDQGHQRLERSRPSSSTKRAARPSK